MKIVIFLTYFILIFQCANIFIIEIQTQVKCFIWNESLREF